MEENSECLEFVQWMKSELEHNRKTRKKFDWRTYKDALAMLEELEKHTLKLKVALINKNPEAIREHLADNFCYLMFIAHIEKLLPSQ